jgi:hypothetical protein
VHEGDLVTGQGHSFDFTMPAGAPPSVKTDHAELYWELELRSDEPGLDTNVRRRLEVG